MSVWAKKRDIYDAVQSGKSKINSLVAKLGIDD